jgi:PAS domain S-box-containing protein
MKMRYNVLLVEDSIPDAFFNLRALEKGGLQVHSERVQTAAEMKRALENATWDFILSDHCLPGFDAVEALEIYKAKGLDIPFIVVSGLIGESQAVKIVKAGAHDYIMKDCLTQLVPAIKRELISADERMLHKRRRSSESFLASMVRDCDDAIIGETLDGHIVSWNSGAQRLYGYAASEIIGGPTTVLESEYRPMERPMILHCLKHGETVPQFETVHLRKNGSAVEVSLKISPVKEEEGKVIGVSMLAQDISPRRQEENDRLTLIRDLSAALSSLQG